jgi:S1-C subfamily serine protease
VLLDDARADLAVLKVDTKGERLPTIAIDDVTRPEVGDLVLAIGDPFGVGQTVTNGIVSALARSDVGINDYAFFIQTDAAINPGNSGGPLVDMEGKLIGVNTAIVSNSGASAGIGFAIPAAMAKQVVDAALGGERAVSRPWLGARGQALTDEMAKSFGLDRPEGVLVTDVWPGGPAARAGIGRGDVILAVDGEPVNDGGGLTYRIATSHVGDEVAIRVRHAGQVRTVSLRTERPPATPAADQRTLAGRTPLSGATVINVSPASAQEYGADPFSAQGVLVTQTGGGVAQSIGVQAGDFIREVNGQKILTTADLAAALQAPAHGWTIVIQRAGQTITARFGA